MRVGSKELLAISCFVCESISLLNLETGESSVAFRLRPDYKPVQMCGGDEGEMFALNVNGVLHLDCSSEDFRLFRVIPVPNWGSGLSYIPGHRLVTYTWSSGTERGIRAASVESRETVWEAKLPLEGHVTNLTSIACSVKWDVLFAVGPLAKRIVVLNAHDGSVKQVVTVDIPEQEGWIHSLCLHGNQLIVHFRVWRGNKVAFFKLCDK